MPFNHYAKIRRILSEQEPGWYIRRINEPTSSLTFKGERRDFDHYYRIYSAEGQQIKYCKFQQIDRLAKILDTPEEQLPIVTAD